MHFDGIWNTWLVLQKPKKWYISIARVLKWGVIQNITAAFKVIQVKFTFSSDRVRVMGWRDKVSGLSNNT